jgi:beta-lactamase class A
MASLPRRELILGAGALALAGCRPRQGSIMAGRTPTLDVERLNREVREIAARLRPGALGAGLLKLDNGEVWTYRGGRRFPMQSVFKAPLAAALLAEVDAGRLSLDESFTLKPMDLSPWSAIAAAWPGRQAYTARELLAAALTTSDNTAADVLMARIGGPGAVTAWLVGKRIDEVRIDRYEREIQTEILGLAPFRPAWRTEAAFQAARAGVPPERQRQALTAFLADPRDTATPRGMLDFLTQLDGGGLVSAGSRRLLLQIMSQARTGPRRILAGLPKGSSFAHKTGTGVVVQGTAAAINDTGIATLPDGRRCSMVVFVSGAPLAPAACEAAIADVARAMVRSLGRG